MFTLEKITGLFRFDYNERTYEKIKEDLRDHVPADKPSEIR